MHTPLAAYVVLGTGNCTVTDCVLLANRGYLMRIRREATQLRIQRRTEAEEALEQQRRDAAQKLGISYESYMARFIHLKAEY